MFANKLVALKARWEKTDKIAGRDIYDIHHFFKQGYDIDQNVVNDLRKTSFEQYLLELINFIEQNISEKILFEDLNPLLTKRQLNQTLPLLKSEVLIALKALV